MWMGIDVGTGGTRALLVDAQGRVVAGFTAAHEDIIMQRPLWAEQRPENWWDAARHAIQGALAQAGVSGSQVRGIGLSGQMHGLVILDDSNAVIRPALIWCDQRSQRQVDAINQTVGRENVLKYTANPVLTGFTLPKLLWVRDNEPRAFERVRHLLLPKDYLRFQLTGEYATDVSDASGTSLFDVVARRWSCDMLDALGLDRAILPTCHESSDLTGRITRAAAEATGLAKARPWWAAAATRPPAPWATASWKRASSRVRWAPPAWSSRTWSMWPTIPQAACTRSAMRCATSGT
jgi:xylulokinase